MGTGSYLPPCPLGTFGNESGLGSVDQCQPCPGGFACQVFNGSLTTTPCEPGYFCRSGASSPTPLKDVSGMYQIMITLYEIPN